MRASHSGRETQSLDGIPTGVPACTLLGLVGKGEGKSANTPGTSPGNHDMHAMRCQNRQQHTINKNINSHLLRQQTTLPPATSTQTLAQTPTLPHPTPTLPPATLTQTPAVCVSTAFREFL